MARSRGRVRRKEREGRQLGTGSPTATPQQTAPAVSQRPVLLPPTFPAFQPGLGGRSHPWALQGQAVPTHAPELTAALAGYLLALTVKLMGPSSAVPT